MIRIDTNHFHILVLYYSVLEFKVFLKYKNKVENAINNLK